MRRFLLLVISLQICGQLALAVPPANDRFANATVIPAAGASNILVDNAEATAERGERGLSKLSAKQTVWYTYTPPADGTLLVADELPLGGSARPTITLFTGTALRKLKPLVLESVPFDAMTFRFFNATRVRAGQKCYLRVDHPKSTSATHTTFRLGFLFSPAGFFRFVDPPPFRAVKEFSYLEGLNTTVPFTIGRLGGTEGTVQVSYSVEAVPRLGGPLTGTLTFGPGVSRQTFTLTLANDGTTQGDVYPDITLSNATGGAVILEQSLEFMIDDDEGRPANDNFAQATPLSGAGSITAPTAVATAEPGEGTARTIWFRYTPAIDGILLLDLPNYTAAQFSRIGVNVQEGSTLAELVRRFPITSNSQENQTRYAVEAGAPIYLQMLNVNDTYSLTPTFAYSVSAESGVVFSTFEDRVFQTAARGSVLQVGVKRVGSAVNVLTVNYAFVPGNNAVAGKDYKDTPGTVTFAAGERTATIPVQILKRSRKGGFGFFQIALSGAPAGVYLASNHFVSLSNSPPQFSALTFATSLAPAPGESTPAFLSMLVGRTGRATGKLTLGAASYSFSTPFRIGDGFIAARTGPTVVPLPGGLTLTLTAEEGVEADLYQPALSAVLKRGDTVLASTDKTLGLQALSGKGAKLAYTLTMEAGAGVPAGFASPGSASLRVSPSRRATLVGTLSDGTKFSAAGGLAGRMDAAFNFNGNPVFPFGVPLYGGKGALHGEVTLGIIRASSPPAAGDGGGTFQWRRPATTDVPAAFVGTLQGKVSDYLVPVGQVVLGGVAPQPLRLTVTDGASQVFPFTLGPRNNVTFDPSLVDRPTALRFDAAKGLFSGTLKDGSSFAGAVLRNVRSGRGSAQFGAGAAGFHSAVVTVAPPP